MPSSVFIQAMHPKSEVRPEAGVITRLLGMGWVGQLKIHGHRAQIHVPADADQDILVYNRQGQRHKQALTTDEVTELRRLFAPKKAWNVIDAEWLKPKGKIFAFDFLKREGELLRSLAYQDRYKLLPRNFISPIVSVLPLLSRLEDCLAVFQRDDEDVEGLVFKSQTPGFHDSSIVRCRKKL